MTIPSHVQAAGNSPLSTSSICGTGTSGLVAVGTTAADALQLSTSLNRITTSSASTGVKLPPTEMGASVWIRNDSGQTLKVYPFNTASTLNATATSFDIPTARVCVCVADSGSTWMVGLLATS
jgi:hypothetical protein